MIHDPVSRQAMVHTVWYVLLAVSLELVLGILVAVTLHRVFRGRGFVLAVLILPWALPSVVSGVLWQRVFDPDNGLLNSVLLDLHVISQPHVWLASGRGAIFYITLVHVWGVLPLVSLIFLAGLQSIPDEVYSASAVDGAGPVRQFTHITLPLLRPSVAIALTVGTLLAISIFDEIYVLNGTALNTRSILMQVYNTTFAQADFAHGTALAFLLAGDHGGAGRALRAGPAEGDAYDAAGLADRAKVVAVLAIVVWSMGPILIGVSTSLSTQREVNAVPTTWVPHHPSLQAYHDLLGGTSGHAGSTVTEKGTFSRSVYNSAILAAVSTFFILIFSTMAAYAVGRLRFRFGGAVLALLVGTMIVPIFVVVVSLFDVLANPPVGPA